MVGNSETGFLTRLICFNRLNYTYVNNPERNNNYTRHRYYDYDVLVNTLENRSIMERQIAAYPGKFVLENVTNMSTDNSGVAGPVTDAINSTKQEFNGTLVCRSQDDVLKSRIAATVHTFLETCVHRPEKIISDSWDLCTATGTFDCNDLRNYTSNCWLARQSTRCSSHIPPPPPAKCGIEQMVDQSEGLMLLIGVLLLGILIGVAIAVAVCLICPKIHSWMHSKLQTKLEITREMSYDTDYTDIDDRMVGALPHYQPSDMALYNVSNISSNSSDYTGSDYDTTNILHSSRQRQYNFHPHGHVDIPNSNGHGTYIGQSDLHGDRKRASYSIGETKESSNHVPGDT